MQFDFVNELMKWFDANGNKVSSIIGADVQSEQSDFELKVSQEFAEKFKSWGPNKQTALNNTQYYLIFQSRVLNLLFHATAWRKEKVRSVGSSSAAGWTSNQSGIARAHWLYGVNCWIFSIAKSIKIKIKDLDQRKAFAAHSQSGSVQVKGLGFVLSSNDLSRLRPTLGWD